MIYIVDTGLNIDEFTDFSNIKFVWSPDGNYADSMNHGTGMAKAVRQTAPLSEIGIIKNCDSDGEVTVGHLRGCLNWLMMNLRPNDKVLWCYSMHQAHVSPDIETLFQSALDLGTWIIPAGNHSGTTKDYFPANICLSRANAYVIGCLNKAGKITQTSNTPANGYVTGSTQPLGEEPQSGTSVSAAYFAGMLDNPQEKYVNAINEVIEIQKIQLD